MDAFVAGIGAAAITFAGGLVGLGLHRLLPERVTEGALRDMTGAVGGLLSLLTALVLGLLIWTAYGVYAGQVAAVRTLATQFLQLDLALADYGQGAQAERSGLKKEVRLLIADAWGGDTNYVARNYGAAIGAWHARELYLKRLPPGTEDQKQAVAAATKAANEIAQTRLQMAIALTDPVSSPLVAIVVAWAVCIFMGFGLMHAKTLDSLGAMAVGAVAVATAVYLLIDLSHPYWGLVRVSPEPLREVMALMGK
jgi:TM2 domain-containing membrane protein YozV